MDESRIPPIQISLAAARVNAGLTQKDVAKAMGVSKNTIVSIENGKRMPKAAELSFFSEIYKMPKAVFSLSTELTSS